MKKSGNGLESGGNEKKVGVIVGVTVGVIVKFVAMESGNGTKKLVWKNTNIRDYTLKRIFRKQVQFRGHKRVLVNHFTH